MIGLDSEDDARESNDWSDYAGLDEEERQRIDQDSKLAAQLQAEEYDNDHHYLGINDYDTSGDEDEDYIDSTDSSHLPSDAAEQVNMFLWNGLWLERLGSARRMMLDQLLKPLKPLSGQIFKGNLSSILEISPKYQAIVKLLLGLWPFKEADVPARTKHDDNFVIITNFPLCAWLTNEA